MKHNFEERRDRRIENAKKLAVKKNEESDRLYRNATQMASVIPMGQPILTGHHSEKRDRNFRGKIDSTMRRSFEEAEKAKYHAGKAKSIESNDAIFSDDPNALEKLAEKLETLKSLQDFMKASNRCVRKNDEAKFLTLKGATPALWKELTTADPVHGMGYPSYRLTNNSASIRRIEGRIAQLKAVESRKAVDRIVNGIRIFENTDANRLQMFFDGKPSDEVRKTLKKYGFRWAPTEGAWQRHISNTAYYNAVSIAESINPENPES